jgi:hypothetical protein
MASAVVTVSAAPDDQYPGPATSRRAPSRPDFMLGRPRGFVGVRGNWLRARAGSDIYDFLTEQLTLEKSSFNTPTIGAEVGVSLSPRLDIVVGFDFSRSSTPSEYRHFVDNKRLPIEQTTSLRQFNLTGSVKFALTPKGQRISQFAWIPRTVTPYVGAGGGFVSYGLHQAGDFVDFQDNHVFPSAFDSDGVVPSAHGFGGVDVQVYRHLYLSLEGRYSWAAGTLKQKFVGFAPIDLAGLRCGAGFHVLF